METQLIETQGVNATFKVTVPADQVDAAFDRVFREFSRSMKVPGFRPGRAPRGVLERRVGREALEDEVKEALVDASYPDAVRELDLAPVHAHFHADAPREGEPFTFEVHAELYPEITLPELSDIVIDAAPRAVDDAMIDETVEQLRTENATLVPVDRSIEGSDYVLLEMLPHPGDEKEGDAAEQEREGGATQPVDMESASDEVRGQLLGKGIGDIVDLVLTDTAEQPDDERASPEERPTRTIRVLIKDVKGKDKPEPDDDFAKTLGLDSWAEAREQVASSLRTQMEREAFDAQREEFVEKLLAATEFDVPQSLVERRSRSLLGDLAEDLSEQGTTLERYMQQLEEKGGTEDFQKELSDAALKSVRRDLVLERLQEMRGTEVGDEEFDEAVRYMARRRRQDAGRFRREMGERWLGNYRFLLARDKALRETVRELVGGAEGEAPGTAEDEEDAARAYEEAAVGAAGEDAPEDGEEQQG